MDRANNERIKEWVQCSSRPENRPAVPASSNFEVLNVTATRQYDETSNSQKTEPSSISFGGQQALSEGMRTLQSHAESALSLAAAVCAAVIPIEHLQCGGSRKPELIDASRQTTNPESQRANNDRTRRAPEIPRYGPSGRPSLNGSPAAHCGDSTERSSQRSSALSAMSTGRGRGSAAMAAAGPNRAVRG
jgi:hypothetical protein